MMQNNKKETYKPILSLNMDDKIYLAVSKDLTDKLSFVYTLACLEQNKNSNMYNMFATREIHAFKNKDAASIYHDTIKKIIDKNAEDKTKQDLFSANEELIENFLGNSR